jgi:hypothetical protein
MAPVVSPEVPISFLLGSLRLSLIALLKLKPLKLSVYFFIDVTKEFSINECLWPTEPVW